VGCSATFFSYLINRQWGNLNPWKGAAVVGFECLFFPACGVDHNKKPVLPGGGEFFFFLKKKSIRERPGLLREQV